MLLGFDENYSELVHLLLFCCFDKDHAQKQLMKKELILAYISRDMKACSGGEGKSVDRHGGASRKLVITWSSTQRKERMGGERNREWDKAINTPQKGCES